MSVRCIHLSGFILRILLVTGMLLPPLHAFSAPPVIDATLSRQDVRDKGSVLNDETHTLKFAEVLQATERFLSPTQVNFERPSSSTNWLHYRIRNTSGVPLERWLVFEASRLLDLTVYESMGHEWIPRQIGMSTPRDQKPVAAQRPVYPVLLGAGQEVDLYVRVGMYSTLQGASLWEPKLYREKELVENIRLDFLLGVLLLLTTFFVYIYCHTRHASYLWFSVLLSSSALLDAARQGWIQAHLWPGFHPFPSVLYTVLSFAAILSTHQLLSKELDSRRTSPVLNTITLVLVMAAFTGMAVSFFAFGPGSIIMVGSVALLIPVFCFTLAKAWSKGNTNARNILFFLSLYWMYEWIHQLSDLGLVSYPRLLSNGLSITLMTSIPLIFSALTMRARHLAQRLLEKEESEQSRLEFLARVSHELRAPLTNVIGFAKLLKSGNTDLSVQEGSQEIERSSLRLLKLIDGLLDESLLVSGRIQLNPEPVHFDEWLRETAQAARLMTQSAGNRFKFKPRGHIPAHVRIDGIRLRQVIDNLVSNANRHTFNGDITLSAWSVQDASQLYLHFSVTDTGCGIKAEDQKRIYHPFVQLHGKDAHDGHHTGLGLGLSIVKDLVRQMGGQIALHSRPGKGSKFFFRVRCEAIPSTDSSAFQQENELWLLQHRSANVPQDKWTALIVDNEAESAAQLAQQLALQGIHAIVVGTASGAISLELQAAASSLPFDLVITGKSLHADDHWMVLLGSKLIAVDTPVIQIVPSVHLPPQAPPGRLGFDALVHAPLNKEAATIIHTLLNQASAARDVAQMIRDAIPPGLELNELRRLVGNGQYTDIENWVKTLMSHSTSYSAFGVIALEYNAMFDYARMERWINSLVSRTV